MKKVIATVVFSLVVYVSIAGEIPQSLIDSAKLASDTTVVSEPAPVKEPVNYGYYIVYLFVGIYEVAVRLFPTVGNYSLLSLVYKYCGMLLPNMKKGGGKHG